MIPEPYKLLIIVLAIGGAFGYGDYYGRRMNNASWEAKYAAAQQEAALQYAAKVEAFNKLADDYERAKADRKVVYETITKTVDRIVDRPVYRNVCIDDDGLRQINAALAGKRADSSQPVAAVPAPVAAQR